MNIRRNAKILFILLFTIFIPINLISCGDKKKDQLINDFNEAFKTGDYPAAYDILKEEINLEEHPLSTDVKRIYEQSDNLFKNWAIEIMNSDNENKNSEVIQLLSLYPLLGRDVKDNIGRIDDKYITGLENYNKLCDNLFQVALTKNDYELAQQIVGCYKEAPNLDYTVTKRKKEARKQLRKFQRNLEGNPEYSKNDIVDLIDDEEFDIAFNVIKTAVENKDTDRSLPVINKKIMMANIAYILDNEELDQKEKGNQLTVLIEEKGIFNSTDLKDEKITKSAQKEMFDKAIEFSKEKNYKETEKILKKESKRYEKSKFLGIF